MKEELLKKGYITRQSLNFCGREVIDFDVGAIEYMHWDTYDHQLQLCFLTRTSHPIIV